MQEAFDFLVRNNLAPGLLFEAFSYRSQIFVRQRLIIDGSCVEDGAQGILLPPERFEEAFRCL